MGQLAVLLMLYQGQCQRAGKGPGAYHGPCVCTAVPLSQVPQVDRELVQLVVTKVPMGQDAIEEGEAQQALALQGLEERREALTVAWYTGWAQCKCPYANFAMCLLSPPCTCEMTVRCTTHGERGQRHHKL